MPTFSGAITVDGALADGANSIDVHVSADGSADAYLLGDLADALMDLTGYGYDYGYEEDCYWEGEDLYCWDLATEQYEKWNGEV